MKAMVRDDGPGILFLPVKMTHKLILLDESTLSGGVGATANDQALFKSTFFWLYLKSGAWAEGPFRCYFVFFYRPRRLSPNLALRKRRRFSRTGRGRLHFGLFVSSLSLFYEPGFGAGLGTAL
jgi:hypothetical protein